MYRQRPGPYGNQPSIGLWNMSRLAETLLPLIDPDPDKALEAAKEALAIYRTRFHADYADLLRRKSEGRGVEHPLERLGALALLPNKTGRCAVKIECCLAPCQIERFEDVSRDTAGLGLDNEHRKASSGACRHQYDVGGHPVGHEPILPRE